MRYANDGNGNNISDRAPRFKQLVEMYNPDIIGTQETTALWNSYFKSYFSGIYGMVGCSRDGVNATSGEWGTILYRLDRFDLLDSGNFWLTSTPDKVSRVTGAKCNRICTWALLRDKLTGEVFVMANTHLDHSTDAVRFLQIQYLFDGLADKISKYPIYLTGDFNATPNSSVYMEATTTLKDAGVTAKLNTSTISYTFDSYGTKNPGSRIDYCFYNDRSTALWYKVLNEQFGGYVSDHYGLIAQFVIKQ
jgi:endonuclease/exonuclease/phosphatase family metal-dependent hydrolase